MLRFRRYAFDYVDADFDADYIPYHDFSLRSFDTLRDAIAALPPL